MAKRKQELLEAYARWPEERWTLGFTPYLVTFMFNPLPGNAQAKMAIMQEEITKTYYKILTAHYRYPNKVPTYNLPMWIACPDRPVPKSVNKDSIIQVTLNDGLHYHAIVMIPPLTRMKMNFEDFIARKQHNFTGKDRYLQRIDVKPITENLAYVTDYTLKAVKNGDMAFEHILVLPKAKSERPSTTRWERKQAKVDGAKARRHHCAPENKPSHRPRWNRLK